MDISDNAVKIKERCKEKVHPNNRWGSFHPRQCHAKIWKHGYCKIHHPDTVRIRQEAKEKRWEEEKENNPILLLQKANKQIEILEAEIKKKDKMIKELEEGIEKHRDITLVYDSGIPEADAELYKLISK